MGPQTVDMGRPGSDRHSRSHGRPSRRAVASDAKQVANVTNDCPERRREPRFVNPCWHDSRPAGRVGFAAGVAVLAGAAGLVVLGAGVAAADTVDGGDFEVSDFGSGSGVVSVPLTDDARSAAVNTPDHVDPARQDVLRERRGGTRVRRVAGPGGARTSGRRGRPAVQPGCRGPSIASTSVAERSRSVRATPTSQASVVDDARRGRWGGAGGHSSVSSSGRVGRREGPGRAAPRRRSTPRWSSWTCGAAGPRNPVALPSAALTSRSVAGRPSPTPADHPAGAIPARAARSRRGAPGGCATQSPRSAPTGAGSAPSQRLYPQLRG